MSKKVNWKKKLVYAEEESGGRVMVDRSFVLKAKKSFINKLIGAGVLGVIISGGFFAYSLNNYWNSLDYLRKKDLEEKCLYILPPRKQERTYHLNNRNKVTIHHKDPFGPGDRFVVSAINVLSLFIFNHLIFN